MVARTSCPDVLLWEELLDGSLTEREQHGLCAHLEACSECQVLLDGMTAPTDDWPDAARHLADQTPPPDPVLRRLIEDLKGDVCRTQAVSEPESASDTMPLLRPP